MDEIFIGSLGGTIAMTRQDGGGAQPRLTAQGLLASVPGLPAGLKVQAHSVLQVASPSISLPDMLAVLDWCNACQQQGARAIILTQGTDTLEETSCLLDLFWPHDVPLILTGAMRLPDSAGADGPANLRAAIEVAQDPGSRGRGVLVVVNETVHAARRVHKSDSLAVQTFTSGSAGPLGRLCEGEVIWFAPATRRPALPPPRRSDHEVALVMMGLGIGPGQLRHALTSPDYAAVVLSALGAGHVPAALAGVVSEGPPGRPLIFCTRCDDGPTTRATYGYPGSEIDLQQRGAWPGGWLSAAKARILIWAILATGATGDQARQLFDARSRP